MAAKYQAKTETPYGPRTCFEARIHREWQAGPGSTVRRDPADTEEERGPLRPHACTDPHPAQGADPPAPQTAVRAVRGTRQGAGAPGPETRQPRERRAKPARMGRAHGQDAAQDPGRLHALSQPRPRPPCHERGVIHRRATCAERRPRGSEEGRTEKGLPPGRTPRRAAYPVSQIHPGAESGTGVNRDRPLRGGRRGRGQVDGRRTPLSPGYRGRPARSGSHACGTWKPCATRRFMTVRR